MIALLLLLGSVYAQEPEAPPVSAGLSPTESYAVGKRDVLRIEVYDEETLSGLFVVGDDGAIDYPLLGPVLASGRTLAEIDAELTSRLQADYLVNPQVKVRVESFASQPVQVLGAVNKPGTFYLSGQTRLLDVLTLAGGVVKDGAVEVRIQRRSRPQEPEVLNLEQLVAFGVGNITLEAGDVIYVPPVPVVYVSGEVEKPGTVAYTDGLTAVQAVNKAGGPSERASLRQVYVLRDGERFRVNARRVLKGRVADFPLSPDDTIYVNESAF